MTIPTTPGFYVSERFPLGTESNHMPYYLDDSGNWWEIREPGWGEGNFPISREDAEMYGPYRPLVAKEEA